MVPPDAVQYCHSSLSEVTTMSRSPSPSTSPIACPLPLGVPRSSPTEHPPQLPQTLFQIIRESCTKVPLPSLR